MRVRRKLAELQHAAVGERDALVGGAKDNVKVERGRGVQQRLCVGGAEGVDERRRVEVANVEEVGGGAPGFQRVAAEAEDVGGEAGLEEGGFVGWERRGGRHFGDGSWDDPDVVGVETAGLVKFP